MPLQPNLRSQVLILQGLHVEEEGIWAQSEQLASMSWSHRHWARLELKVLNLILRWDGLGLRLLMAVTHHKG